MGWGESHSRGAGTTKQIEEAHQAMDSIGIPKSGSLSVRVWILVETMKLIQTEIRQINLDLKKWGSISGTSRPSSESGGQPR